MEEAGSAAGADGGVAHGAELRRFARAVIGDAEDLDAVRAALVGTLDAHRVGQAAAVVAGFDSINRVADATGIELNTEMAQRSRDLVETLGLERMRG